MQQSVSSVLLAGEQGDLKAQQEYEKVAEAVANGQLRGVLVSGEKATRDNPGRVKANRVRHGAAIGARAGFVVGLIPFLTSIAVGAGAGALLVKASDVRIEKGTAPRVRFGQSSR